MNNNIRMKKMHWSRWHQLSASYWGTISEAHDCHVNH